MIKSILIYEYQEESTRANTGQHESNTSPTRVNTNQYELIRVRHDFTRINTIVTGVNTSHIRVNTNQHESKTGLDQILLKI